MTPLVESSYLLVVFIIRYYLESLFHVLFHLVYPGVVPQFGPFNIFRLSLSKYLDFYYSSFQIMDDALMHSFQWISSYHPQHILLWDRDLESFLRPRGLQSSMASSLAIDSGNTSMSHDRYILSGVQHKLLYSHLLYFTRYLDSHIIIAGLSHVF